MQQQQQQLAAGVTDIAALSAVEQPLLGPAGSSQQQQQQQQQEADEGEGLELSEDMAEMADLLKGVSDATMFRERMEEALTTGGGGEQAICQAGPANSGMFVALWRLARTRLVLHGGGRLPSCLTGISATVRATARTSVCCVPG
jgi:hypothetical protein